MKILRVISSMNPSVGGPCQGIRNSTPALKLLGVETEVLCFDDIEDNYDVQDDFVIHKIGPTIGPYAYVKNLHKWLQINLNRFDFVIIHGLWLYNSYGTYKTWNRFKRFNTSKPKLFVMPHGMLDPYFQKAPERKLKAIRNIIFWRLFEKEVINFSNGILFTCQRELELARTTFKGYNPKKEIDVSYGVQRPPQYSKVMDYVFRDKIGLKSDEKYVLFLSRIHEKKGIDLLIDAYISLKERIPDFPKLVVAGPVDGDFAQSLVGATSDRDDIIFAGMLKGDSKWGALYGAEIFILPSHQENFGIAVVEAMACGTPVAITDQVNIFTVIESYKAGYVFQDNLGSTKEVLSLIANDFQEGLLANMGRNAKSAYENNYQPEGAARKLIDALCQE